VNTVIFQGSQAIQIKMREKKVFTSNFFYFLPKISVDVLSLSLEFSHLY